MISSLPLPLFFWLLPSPPLSSTALSFSPLPSLWSFKLEKKLHWDSWTRGGDEGLATPSKWSRWSFFSIFFFFLSRIFLFFLLSPLSLYLFLKKKTIDTFHDLFFIYVGLVFIMWRWPWNNIYDLFYMEFYVDLCQCLPWGPTNSWFVVWYYLFYFLVCVSSLLEGLLVSSVACCFI